MVAAAAVALVGTRVHLAYGRAGGGLAFHRTPSSLLPPFPFTAPPLSRRAGRTSEANIPLYRPALRFSRLHLSVYMEAGGRN